jgi:hypothetical protein
VASVTSTIRPSVSGSTSAAATPQRAGVVGRQAFGGGRYGRRRVGRRGGAGQRLRQLGLVLDLVHVRSLGVGHQRQAGPVLAVEPGLVLLADLVQARGHERPRLGELSVVDAVGHVDHEHHGLAADRAREARQRERERHRREHREPGQELQGELEPRQVDQGLAEHRDQQRQHGHRHEPQRLGVGQHRLALASVREPLGEPQRQRHRDRTRLRPPHEQRQRGPQAQRQGQRREHDGVAPGAGPLAHTVTLRW